MDERERTQRGQPEGDEEARLRRPEKQIKDLETPAEASEQVQGGGIRFSGVKGESGDSKHKDEIDV